MCGFADNLTLGSKEPCRRPQPVKGMVEATGAPVPLPLAEGKGLVETREKSPRNTRCQSPGKGTEAPSLVPPLARPKT